MIDFNRLYQLFNGDQKLVKKFLRIFKQQTPIQLAELATFIEGENWAQVSIVAHSLKSQIKYLNLKDLATLAYHIEQRAELNKGVDKIPLLFERLQVGLEEILAELA